VNNQTPLPDQSQKTLCEYYKRKHPLSFEIIRQMIVRGDTPGMVKKWQAQINEKAASDWFQVASYLQKGE
jgi:hypothetical protein